MAKVKNHHHNKNPRRGPPAVFVSCEVGRERKAEREAMDLLHHYYYASKSCSRQSSQTRSDSGVEGERAEKSDADDCPEFEPLTLAEELSLLRKGAAVEEVLSYERDAKRQKTDASTVSLKSPFAVFDTGSRGMVCIICKLHGSDMVPYADILTKIKGASESESKCGGTGDTSTGNDSISNSPTDPLWDPVETVRCIMTDASILANTGEKSVGKLTTPTQPPGSRFISRLQPFQATCFASVEEIKEVAIALLNKFLPQMKFPAKKEVTFKLEIKRRLCEHIKTSDILDAVAPLLLDGLVGVQRQFKVQLADPDFSIRIETSKSLCGVSVLPRAGWHKNFNLAVNR